MAYEPLHHKYRPQTFGQLVGQGAIATTLSNALQQNRIAPAYLFCGPRGTGKTSSARILAKSLNCLNSPVPTPEPCGTCQVCREITVGASLDIVEIDAASNTGVDNIRELIERAQFAPVQCRHKLYVLDEVHMLSTAAFNALLKTLEEPPPQVVFVLATTDPQRVLPTIISRCQRFDFRRIPLDAMVQHLTYIAQQESIAITPDALQLVAQLSQGGLRDAESLLDQLGLLDGEITIEAVWDLVGAVPERDLLTLVQAVGADDGSQVLILARQLMDRGREPLMVLQSLVAFYRDLLIAKTAGERRDLVAITPTIWAEMVPFAQGLPLTLLLASQQHLRTAEVQVKNTTQPRLWLEITLMGLLPSAQGQLVTAVSVPAVTAPAAKHLPVQSPSRPPSSSPPSVTPQVNSLTSAVPAPVSPLAEQPAPIPSAPAPSAPVSPIADKPAPVAPAPVSPGVDQSTVQPTVFPAPQIDPEDEPNAASPASPSTKTAAAPAMGSLSDIWAKIVAQLTPMGTQVLMRQHGHLLSCDGVEARVGITNDKLMRMAEDRLRNVEIALEKVFGYKLQVSMVVAPSDATAAPPPVAQFSTAQPQPKASIPPPARLPTPQEKTSPASAPAQAVLGNSRPAAQNPPAPPAASVSPVPLAAPVTPAIVSPQGQDATNTPASWQSESDLERSVKSFAQFFSGQIVNLDDDPTDEAEATTQSGQPSNQPSAEPGPDVPF
ncbi:DNA polymerase III subunit gamma/tau [Leptothoe sp. PORK10 BA2]|uniref:DNA polymerase III subunit gamma/tau n=1 Tax=Leptothoe sp. PORK10 BA2 TaxID=3110254 RepID=UPI002B1F0785|nr:DNA polymerase III subunit gamma/tau [Leptothoe sp. PORK10 BA2]MEA5464005.1 DNA polymerase III subunit gamma/tau [Leptothoe sp. PORK10 BA2]